MSDIKIVDVILTKDSFGRERNYFVVVDRMPELVYTKTGQRLTANDSGFYDFLCESPGTTDAFAGRKFTIKLSDGGLFECRGQVWSCAPPKDIEEVVQVGVSTIEGLRACYVFSSAHISKALLVGWLDGNIPSRNYYKYDPRETVEWGVDLVNKNPGWCKPISPARARKLRRRGAHIFRSDSGLPMWCKWLENHKRKVASQGEAA